ncbi:MULTISPECIES: ribosome biogenesis GTP-binding protein YihA/YsxC [unclassified Gemella]|uniref:ribosome biogenesis GTP-binding protein YihA/YsxC n=1 Tax=unclassified Gemella TaxID=2624949 RepID=UPI0015CF8EDF|nr:MULTISPECIES: ribosome biogenesis GTP-binding protein YihA/YsxC [unclassified Gemella]MBF0710003.1 YihA family ribosome biogenesis GTP-binding protein [Gemella sp. GL1.1]NYS27347.1 YihA family ribosome biogenesis GTP-binding protein [Gemella sp. GL1]
MAKFNINNVDLIISAVSKKQYPEHSLPEVAMCGRSNVGKSSFINTILNRKNYARVSAKPGKTRTLNFFDIDSKLVLVDVPGYGYAKLSKTEKEKLYDMIVEYFVNSKNLSFVMHLLDSRHNPSEDDIMMNEFLNYYEIPFLIVLTKTDKISKNELIKNMKKIENKLDFTNNIDIIPFSSVKKINVDKIIEQMDKVVDTNED